MLSVDAAVARVPQPKRVAPATTTMSLVTKKCEDGHETVYWDTDRREPLPCWACQPEAWE